MLYPEISQEIDVRSRIPLDIQRGSQRNESTPRNHSRGFIGAKPEVPPGIAHYQTSNQEFLFGLFQVFFSEILPRVRREILHKICKKFFTRSLHGFLTPSMIPPDIFEDKF